MLLLPGSRKAAGERQGFLDGINPKLLRAAAKDPGDKSLPQFIENKDWRIEVAKSSGGASISFLEADQPGRRISSPPADGRQSYSKLTVNAFSKTLQARENPQLSGADFSYSVHSPPKIALRGSLLRRRNTSTLILKGRAVHPLCVRDVMVFADKKKILFLSNGSRSNAGYIEFSADIPLNDSVSHILVVARHNDEVMGSQSLLVKPSQKRRS